MGVCRLSGGYSGFNLPFRLVETTREFYNCRLKNVNNSRKRRQKNPAQGRDASGQWDGLGRIRRSAGKTEQAGGLYTEPQRFYSTPALLLALDPGTR